MNKQFLETVFLERLKEFKNFKKHLELDLKIKEKHHQSASVDELLHEISKKVEVFYESFIAKVLEHKERTFQKIMEGPILERIKEYKASWKSMSNISGAVFKKIEKALEQLQQSLASENFFSNLSFFDEEYKNEIGENVKEIISDRVCTIDEEIKSFKICLNENKANLDSLIQISYEVPSELENKQLGIKGKLNDPVYIYI